MNCSWPPNWCGEVLRSPALAARLAGWSGAARLIQDWCAWRGAAQKGEVLGLGPLLDAMQGGLVAPRDAARALEANDACWWINGAVERAPHLRAFVAARHETRLGPVQGRAPTLPKNSANPVAARRHRASRPVLPYATGKAEAGGSS